MKKFVYNLIEFNASAEGPLDNKNKPRPPVLFLSSVVPFGRTKKFWELYSKLPCNTGPAVTSTLLVSPGWNVVIPMGLSVAVGVGELKRSPYAEMI